MNNHLFLFTIGPVQSFIAAARKTHDLYAGSQILSDLVDTGMRAFKAEFPTGKVIFPEISDESLEKSERSLPNRFIGKVSAEKNELKIKAEAIQKAVEAKWIEIAKIAFKDAGVGPIEPRSTLQLRALLDIHWIFQIQEGKYSDAYMKLERLGGAIKNIRRFSQFPEWGRKCSIDGTNNALYLKKGTDPVAYMANPVPVKLGLAEGERLSAVSLAKRFFPVSEKFPSTSRVALMHDIANLSPEDKDRLECFESLFKEKEIAETCIKMFNKGFVKNINISNYTDLNTWNNDWDEHYLFEENLAKITSPEQKQLLYGLHSSLVKKLKTRYYAIIRFDGDKMGEWLSGANNKKQEDLEEFQSELSGALARFAKEARSYLNQAEGRGHTIYAGGDDFLGFVNIHHLFGVMKHLRERFDVVVNSAISNFKQPDKHLTFSAGIVIAHYKTPFSEVLKKTKAVESIAKKEGGSNAFAIAVMKHSGEIHQAIYKWDKEAFSASGCSNLEAFEHISKSLDKEEGDFSNNFIQNLTHEILGLAGIDMKNLPTDSRGKDIIHLIIPEEIKRLLNRSYKEEKIKHKEKIDSLHKSVVDLWMNSPKDSNHRPRNFIHALHVADFLTRKITKEA